MNDKEFKELVKIAVEKLKDESVLKPMLTTQQWYGISSENTALN